MAQSSKKSSGKLGYQKTRDLSRTKLAYESVSKPRNILKMPKKDMTTFLESFDYVISDLEGVITKFEEPISGSGDAIARLRHAGKHYKFLINDSMQADEFYVQDLKKMGILDVKNADILQPVKTIVRHLTRHKVGNSVLSICSKEVNDMLEKSDIQLITIEPNTKLEPSNIVNYININKKVSAVIVDLNYNLSFLELAIAHQCLINEKNCTLLVGSSDTYKPLAPHMTTIGNAGFINILCDMSGKTPMILGKPGSEAGEDLKQVLELRDPRRALFIGASLITDIQFGINCGFQTLFVLSGTSKEADMAVLPDNLKPDYIASKLGDFIEFFDRLK